LFQTCDRLSIEDCPNPDALFSTILNCRVIDYHRTTVGYTSRGNPRERVLQLYNLELVVDPLTEGEDEFPVDFYEVNDYAEEKLKPDQFEVFQYHYIDGLKGSEISKKTGIPLGTIHARMARGMNKLKKRFAKSA